ncbi:hypothetical protein DFQ27_007484 [Actinomortierella ambigua]|uniref:Major facilitator superfamily (MFS) profile domain-containing protein n=1 Tax=Actinomortierella ambigua TaxID=1343610 RepID=A0A9P6PV31_9FUNG|nr:hypothetical protein DFQ27_007484 [Actinomortierella ambigua]
MSQHPSQIEELNGSAIPVSNLAPTEPFTAEADGPVRHSSDFTKSPSSVTLGDPEKMIDGKAEEDDDLESAEPAGLEQPAVLVDGPPYGWVIIAASFFLQFISLGIANIFGVYQNYYLNHAYKGRASAFEISWIGSLTIVTLDMLGPYTGALCDYVGHRQTAMMGIVVMSLSLVAAAFAQEVWQLYLAQGFLYGVGCSLTYFASLTIPSQWFTKNRGMVTGMAIAGGGIGGMILSPVVSKLLESLGLRWTILITAIAQAALLLPAAMLLRTRIETGRERARRIQQYGYRKGESLEQDKKRKFVDWSILRTNRRVLLLFLTGIPVVAGYFAPFYFISTYATQNGASSSTAAMLVGVMNGSSALGRVLTGMAADRAGPINSLFTVLVTACLSVFLIWSFAKTVAVMYVFAVIYGIACGGFVSVIPTVTGSICGLDRLTMVTGIIYAGMAIGAVIGTSSGAILDTIGGGTDYTSLIVWTGSVLAIGSSCVFVLKWMTNRNMFVKV